MPIESVTPSSHHILCHPLLLLPPIPPSIRVFSNELTLRMRWPKFLAHNKYSHNVSCSKSFLLEMMKLREVTCLAHGHVTRCVSRKKLSLELKTVLLQSCCSSLYLQEIPGESLCPTRRAQENHSYHSPSLSPSSPPPAPPILW